MLVDPDHAAAVAIDANLDATGFASIASVVRRPAAQYVRGGAPGGPFDLVVLDPPYDTPAAEVGDLLGALATSGALSVGATVVVERPAGGDPLVLPPGWDVRRERSYGDTLLLIVSV